MSDLGKLLDEYRAAVLDEYTVTSEELEYRAAILAHVAELRAHSYNEAINDAIAWLRQMAPHYDDDGTASFNSAANNLHSWLLPTSDAETPCQQALRERAQKAEAGLTALRSGLAKLTGRYADEDETAPAPDLQLLRGVLLYRECSERGKSAEAKLARVRAALQACTDRCVTLDLPRYREIREALVDE
jgi:hypothetical protein